MSSRSIQTVFFDLDGTLVDQFAPIYRSYSFVAKELSVPLIAEKEVKKQIGGSLPITLGKLLGEDNVARALPLFNKHFEGIMFEGLHIQPGAEWILKGLKEKKVQTVLFTNKDQKAAEACCKHLNIDHLFDHHVTTGNIPWRKPMKEFTEHGLKVASAKAENSVVIGDSNYDAEAAETCGLGAYLLTTGTHDREALSVLKVEGVYDSLYEIGEAVFGLNPEN